MSSRSRRNTCSLMVFLVLMMLHLSTTMAQEVHSDEKQESRTPTRTTPCADLFTLDRDALYQQHYVGTLALQTELPLAGIEIEIQFDRAVDRLVNFFGRSSTTDKHSYRIVNDNYTLTAHRTLNVELEVSYATSDMPNITSVTLNGARLCSTDLTDLDTANTTTSLSDVDSSIGVDETIPPPSSATTVDHYYPYAYGQARPYRPLRPAVVPVRVHYLPQPTYQPIATRNFMKNQRTSFNSSCQAISPEVRISASRWDAVLNLVAETTMNRARIEIVFDRPIYTLGNHFGNVQTKDGQRFVIENPSYILAEGADLEIAFFIRYNELGPLPDVEEVNFNGRDHCKQRKRRVLNEDTVAPWLQANVETTSTTTKTASDEVFADLDEPECAATMHSVPRAQSRIIGGVTANQGQLPWHVAIFYDDQYQCGGTIVSRGCILTAAHCLTRPNSNDTLDLSQMRVYAGMIDIGTADDYMYYTPSSAVIHQDYNAATHTTDIGILKLRQNITFNSFIKPACLYNQTVDISAFYTRHGMVAGWGFNRDGVISNMLNYLDVPVVSQKRCSQTNVEYNTVLAMGESFCAGHANGNSVCNGDSGGGLVFVDDDHYYLRGIVSISAQKRNQMTCDSASYSVFTDVSKFLRWIRRNIR